MSRNGAGVYSLPAGSTVTNGDVSDATDINTPLADIAADLNVARPIVAGGTGAVTAAAALANLGLTATAAEINIMDGVTASTAELNILDGATLTVTELNYVDGVTSAIQTQIDGKQPLDADLTALAALATAGLIARTGAGTVAARTLTAGTGISISNGDGVAGNPTITSTGLGASVQVFTANGTYTPTAGKKSAIVFCTGGGEAGTAQTTNNSLGAGGGAGATAVAIVDISSGATHAVTVGAGGASSSGNGGTTSLGSACSATGGGVAVATTGILGIAGAIGGASSVGHGGGSFWGGGAFAGAGAGAVGPAGLAYGSGGAGGIGNGGSIAGGAGAGGVVLILEF